MNIFVPIIIDMIDCALTTTSKVSDCGMIDWQLGHLECLLFGHVPVVVCVQTPLRECAATAATEHVAFDFLHGLTAIQKVQVNALVVEPANETAQTKSRVSLGSQHVTQGACSFTDLDFPVFLQTHEFNLWAEECKPLLTVCCTAGHGAEDVIVHLDALHHCTVWDVRTHWSPWVNCDHCTTLLLKC